VKIPAEKLKEFEEAAEGLLYGKVTLVVHLKNGKPRYELKMKKTFSAEGDDGNKH
jgi:hypothetical protein